MEEMKSQKLAAQMTEGVIWKQLLFFALPLMFSNLLQQLYNTVDAIIVGKNVGPKALAAVGSSGQLIVFMIYFFIGLSIGASIIISQAYGAGDHRRVEEAVHTSAALSLISGLVLMLAGMFLAPIFLGWMNVPEDVMGMAVLYIRLYFLSMIPMMIYNMGSGVLRAIGDTKTALYCLGAASVLNIGLDILFVAELDMGVAGAAIASTMSQTLSAVLVVIKLVKTKEVYRLVPKRIRLVMPVLKSIVKIGMPTGLQSVVVCFANVVVQSQINIFGLDVMAGYTAYIKIDGFLFMPTDAFGMAVSNFVGQNIGAGRYDRVKKSLKAGLCMSIGVSIFLGTLICLNGRTVLGFFSDDPNVITYGLMMMFTMVPLYSVFASNQIFSGVIRGAGQATIPMVINLVAMCGLRITWISVMLKIVKDVRVIYVGYPLTWIVTFCVFILYYKKGHWLKQYEKEVN